jgi:hypothetical protein
VREEEQWGLRLNQLAPCEAATTCKAQITRRTQRTGSESERLRTNINDNNCVNPGHPQRTGARRGQQYGKPSHRQSTVRHKRVQQCAVRQVCGW